MKKYFVLFSALLLLATSLVSCKKNTPKDVATTWLNGFWHGDYEAPQKTSTEDTKKLLMQLQQLSNMTADSNKEALKRIVITVKDVKENGDNAVVTYTLSDMPDKDLKLPLVKQNGQWLSAFSKTDVADGEAGTDQSNGADTTSQGTSPADTSMTDTMKH